MLFNGKTLAVAAEFSGGGSLSAEIVGNILVVALNGNLTASIEDGVLAVLAASIKDGVLVVA